MGRRPNVLMVVADQHRHDWVESEDATVPVRTPTLRRLAERGVRFRRAVTPSPLCAPARACLAAAMSYDRNPVRDNFMDFPPEAPTYYRALRDEGGYFVAGVGKFDLHKRTRDWGLDGSRLLAEWGLSDGIDNEGKFDSLVSGREAPHGPYMNYLYENGLAAEHIADFSRRHPAPYADTQLSPLPEDAYLDNWIAANALSMLERCPQDAPWHLVVNFAGPHDPVDVTAPMLESWSEVDFPPPVDADPSFAGDHQEVRRRYAAMIENIDAHIARLLDAIDKRGELDDTVVIYTSDHGEMLGDHGQWAKRSHHHPSVGIPLIVSGPGVVPGTVSDALVSLEDVAGTILDFAGVDPAPDMDARSFRPVLAKSAETHRDVVVSGLDTSEELLRLMEQRGQGGRHRGPLSWRALITETHKLVIRDDLDAPLLYDLAHDPDELHDRAADEPDRVRELLGLLHEAMADARPA